MYLSFRFDGFDRHGAHISRVLINGVNCVGAVNHVNDCHRHVDTEHIDTC